jgi:hypothetical protein
MVILNIPIPNTYKCKECGKYTHSSVYYYCKSCFDIKCRTSIHTIYTRNKKDIIDLIAEHCQKIADALISEEKSQYEGLNKIIQKEYYRGIEEEISTTLF